jgi:hypothetical protein
VLSEITESALDPGEFTYERPLEPDEASELGSIEDRLEAGDDTGDDIFEEPE